MKNYFTISELCESDTARAKSIRNIPFTLEVLDNLHLLITECLNPIRECFGKPIYVNSGYRCAELNKAVGGVATSQHLRGEATDIRGANDAETEQIYNIAKSLGRFDQLLFESNGKGVKWVHLSYKKNGNRGQAIDNYKA